MTVPMRALRQAQIIVRDVEVSAPTLAELLGLSTPWRYDSEDGAMRMWGLRAGNTFLELMMPRHPAVPLARFLDQHGEGLYLLVLHSDRERDAYALELLSRWVHLSGTWHDNQYRLIWVHPKAATGVVLELGEVAHPENPWTGGGGPGRDDWYRTEAVGDIRQIRHAVVVVRDLAKAVRRWRHLFGMEPGWEERGEAVARAVLPFADGDTGLELRQPCGTSGPEAEFLGARGEGLFSLVLEADDLDAIERRSRDAGVHEPLTTDHPALEGFVVQGPATAGARLEIVRPVEAGAWPLLAAVEPVGGRRA